MAFKKLKNILLASAAALSLLPINSRSNIIDSYISAGYASSTPSKKIGTEISPDMTVKSSEKRLIQDFDLRGKVRLNLGRNTKENFGIDERETLIFDEIINSVTLENILNLQGGTFKREMNVSGFFDVLEEGKQSKLRNLSSLTLTPELSRFMPNLFGIGFTNFYQSEKSNYKQNVPGASNNVKTSQSLGLNGLTVSISHGEKIPKQPFYFLFYGGTTFFMDGKEIYMLSFANKDLPGDTTFTRTRDVTGAYLTKLEARLETRNDIPIFNITGIKLEYDRLQKNTAEVQSTESHMPIFEKNKVIDSIKTIVFYTTIPRISNAKYGGTMGSLEHITDGIQIELKYQMESNTLKGTTNSNNSVENRLSILGKVSRSF